MVGKCVVPLLVAVVALSGCATIPTGPSVMVLPGPAKTLEQFQADDALCRQWAGQQVGGTAVGASASQAYGPTVQWRYDMAYQQCMYTKGHQIAGVPARYATPPPPPPISGGPAPSPPPPQPH